MVSFISDKDESPIPSTVLRTGSIFPLGGERGRRLRVLGVMGRPEQLAEAAERYRGALVEGDARLARVVVDEALGRGISRAEIYLDVLAPAQVRMGELWHEGRINVADEHLATTITMEMMDRLRAGMRPSPGHGARAVVTPVEGDQHWTGARMIADFLLMDGWEVYFLSEGTPAADLAAFARQRRVDLVALSCTLSDLLPKAAAAAEALRAGGPPCPKTLVGGAAVDGAGAGTLGCDAVAANGLEAVSEARRLVGLAARKLTLEEQLHVMGRRIHGIRTSSGMTQRELAEASGLDRTYISLVEHGRQNLSVGAVLRIAQALDVPIGDLLEPGGQEV